MAEPSVAGAPPTASVETIEVQYAKELQKIRREMLTLSSRLEDVIAKIK